jgi:soluble lytic murein transglycosylase
VAGLFVAIASPAGADTPMMQALTAHDWAAAQALAARDTDPLSVQLVHYIRLLTPGQADAVEIGGFMAAHPGWPEQPVLKKRLSEAVARETDPAQTLADCEKYKPALDTALVRCAAVERAAGHGKQAVALARQAWMTGILGAAEEDSFLNDWGNDITAAEQWRRFDALDWAGNAAADRQAARVDASHRALARARLALRHDDARALDYLPTVPAAQRSDPALILEQSRWFRQQNTLPPALDLWRAAGVRAEVGALAEHGPAFWLERDRLARALVADGDNEGAYFLADDTHVDTDQAPDALFLAGWIALRRLHDVPRAAAKFQALAALSPSVITQARAYYWLARTVADGAAVKQDFARAAAYPTTYYGQLAIAASDGAAAIPGRIAAFTGPAPAAAQEGDYARGELVRAAAKLLAWQDSDRARSFLARRTLDAPANVPSLVLAARQATAMGLPDVAVLAARLAGRQGAVLKQYGWPRPYQPPAGVDAPLVLGVMRQESSFDPAIVSHAGAIGLMQMMPTTARQEGGDPDALKNPDVNMQLGVGYLHKLLDQFGGVVPYAVAAYNAGPHRVRGWIAANGDAAAKPPEALPSDAMIDWIEQIPFGETRNYVQRVLENREIYAAAAP